MPSTILDLSENGIEPFAASANPQCISFANFKYANDIKSSKQLTDIIKYTFFCK